jgi:hypothetical protein
MTDQPVQTAPITPQPAPAPEKDCVDVDVKGAKIKLTLSGIIAIAGVLIIAGIIIAFLYSDWSCGTVHHDASDMPKKVMRHDK